MSTRKKSLILTIAIFLFCLNLSQAFAQPQQQNYKVSFSARASGAAVALPNYIPGDTEPEEAIIGKGEFVICGSAVASGPYDPNEGVPYPFYFAENSVKAIGAVSAKWNGHAINAILVSNVGTDGIFVDKNEGNVFIAGAFPGADSLSFKAVYKDQRGSRIISGKAGAFALQLGDTGVVGIAVIFFNPDNTPLLTIIWAQNEVQTPSGPILPAASTFQRCVKIAPK